MVCQPVAPSGAGGAWVAVWVSPSVSVARTVMVWLPLVACHDSTHWRQESIEGSSARRACCHGSLSTRTSTALIPRCCAQAIPATATFPALTRSPARGTSMRDSVLTGPRADQPLGVQYPWSTAKVVTFRSVTHLVADT